MERLGKESGYEDEFRNFDDHHKRERKRLAPLNESRHDIAVSFNDRKGTKKRKSGIDTSIQAGLWYRTDFTLCERQAF